MDTAEFLISSRFFLRLELPDASEVDAIFLECQKIQRSQAPIEIVEVGPQKWGKAKYGYLTTTQIPGRAKPENLVLRRGMTNSKTLWNWFNAVETGSWQQQEAEGSLSIYDQAGNEQVRYDFQGAWPTRYTATDFSAQSTEFEIEELELIVSNLVRAK